MSTHLRTQGRPAELKGRREERDVLELLADAVRSGESRTLVLRGEPGVGKTALLDYLVEQASGCRVVRAAGVQSEMELAFAGLHQLVAPMLAGLERLPVPQRCIADGVWREWRVGARSLSGRSRRLEPALRRG